MCLPYCCIEVAEFLKIMACWTQRYTVDGREMGDIPDADNFLCPKSFVLNIWKHYKQEWIIGVFKAEQGTVPMATKM